MPADAVSRKIGTGRATSSDGACIAYQTDGPTAAPPLMLLQGQANSHRWWTHLRNAFADEFLTVTFDYRGTGKTTTADDRGTPWSTSIFADDAIAVLDALGYDQAAIYGTSMGGRVAQMIAVNHSKRVQRLVLACTAPGGTASRERDQSVRRLLAQTDSSARRIALVDLMYTPLWGAKNGSTSNLLGDETMTPDSLRRHLKVSREHDASSMLGRVTADTLVLHGGDDRIVPASNAEVLANLLPRARLKITPQGRHGFFDEFASEVVPTVLEFLSGDCRESGEASVADGHSP